MKILCVDQTGSGLDWLLRCRRDGHTVKWFIRNNNGQTSIGDGFEGLEKVDDYRPWLIWADLVFCTDNTYYLDDLDNARSRGVPVFGPSKLGAELELDRQFGQKLLAKHGIPTIPSREFTDYDTAIAYVKREMKRLVSKPCGNEENKALSYVSKSPEDMLFMLNRWKRESKIKESFVLQDFRPGIEMAVGGWVGPNGFATGWCENFEFKKLMVGDCGPNTGEMGCYSADTEVLTSDGWKMWPDVSLDDHLATLRDGALEFEKPSQVVSYDMDGEMVQWKNRSIDILVTPNHNMYVADQFSARKKSPRYKFVPAEDCIQSQYSILRTADFHGDSPEDYLVHGRTTGKHRCADIPVTFSEWCWFLGFWFAEGSSNGGQVQIAQSHPVKSEKAWAHLSRLPFNVKRVRHGFSISNTALAKTLKVFGRSYEKRVPQYILDARKEDIAQFLDGFALGDGHVQPSGARNFYTSNKGLADDLQELMLRCGHLGIIKNRGRRERLAFIGDRQIHQRRDAYVVFERTRKITSWLDSRDREMVPYRGKVYCATVSSHVLFVRRGGKPVWCGNTVVRVVRDSKLARRVLAPLEPDLIQMGLTGYVDVNCIIDEDGRAWPLEFTARPGWPLFNIQQSLITGDHALWMKKILDGQRTNPWTMDTVSLGVVMAIPDFPYSKQTKKEVSNIPVYGASWPDENFHPCELKLGIGPKEVNGKISDVPMLVTAGDYLLVVTGTGETVSEAKKAAYSSLKKISTPMSPLYRTDIGDRLKKQLGVLQSHGYASGLRFS